MHDAADARRRVSAEAVERTRGRSAPSPPGPCAATAWIVPDEPTATSKPCAATSRPNGESVERTNVRHDDTALGVEALAGEEAVGQADGAELEAAGRQHLALLADQHLGDAAADVAQQQALVEHRHGLQHAEVDEAGLLDARR